MLHPFVHLYNFLLRFAKVCPQNILLRNANSSFRRCCSMTKELCLTTKVNCCILSVNISPNHLCWPMKHALGPAARPQQAWRCPGEQRTVRLWSLGRCSCKREIGWGREANWSSFHHLGVNWSTCEDPYWQPQHPFPLILGWVHDFSRAQGVLSISKQHEAHQPHAYTAYPTSSAFFSDIHAMGEQAMTMFKDMGLLRILLVKSPMSLNIVMDMFASGSHRWHLHRGCQMRAQVQQLELSMDKPLFARMVSETSVMDLRKVLPGLEDMVADSTTNHILKARSWPFAQARIWLEPRIPSELAMPAARRGGGDRKHMGMAQYLLIPFLGGWTSIYQLFWCELQGYKVLTHCRMWRTEFVTIFFEDWLAGVDWPSRQDHSAAGSKPGGCGVQYLSAWPQACARQGHEAGP